MITSPCLIELFVTTDAYVGVYTNQNKTAAKATQEIFEKFDKDLCSRIVQTIPFYRYFAEELWMGVRSVVPTENKECLAAAIVELFSKYVKDNWDTDSEIYCIGFPEEYQPEERR